MNWQLLNIGIALVSAVIMLGLGILSLQRRHTQAVSGFIFLVACIGFASLFFAFGLASTQLAVITIWKKLEYMAMVGLPLAWLLFSFQFTNQDGWLTWARMGLLSVIPVVSIALVATNEWHELIWTNTYVDESGLIAVFKADYGWWFWVNLAYTSVLILLGSFALLRMALSSWEVYRGQSALLLVSAFIPLLGNLSQVVDFSPTPRLNFVTMTFTLGSISLAWAVFRLDVLDILPSAYDRVVKNLSDGVLVLDMQQRVLALNPALKDFLQTTASESMIGKRFDRTFPSLAEYLPENAAEAYHEVQLGDTWIELRFFPLFERQHHMRGQVAIFRDITERKQTENELEDQINRLSILQQVNKEVSRTLDADRILFIALDTALRVSNAFAGLIGLLEDSQEVRIAHINGPYPPEYKPGYLLPAEKSVTGRVIRSRKAERVLDVHSDPDYVSILPETRAIMILPLIAQEKFMGLMKLEMRYPSYCDEETLRFLQILLNRIAAALENARLHQDARTQLSELQDLYQRLSQLEQLKSDMIRIAVHDLGNPLTAIKGFLEMMEDETFEPRVREYLTSMNNSVERMQRIMKDILSLERIETLADPASGEIFDLVKQVEQGVREYEGQIAQKLQVLQVDLGERRPVRVHGDPVQVHEAISNLIGNAVKYTSEGGAITVRLTAENGQVTFAVQDTGFGIPEDMQEQLFRPFYRAMTPESSKVEGTGLGLHLVKKIIERHQGKMLVESVYGEGSTFGFILPTLPPAEKF